MILEKKPQVGLTVVDMLKRTVKLNHILPALVTDTRTLSYQELDEHAEMLAFWLMGKGAKKGDRVLLWGVNSIELVETFMACAKAGLVAVPINIHANQDEVEYIFRDNEPSFVFSDKPLNTKWSQKNGLIKVTYNGEQNDTFRYANIFKNVENQVLPEVNPEDGFVMLYTAAVGGQPKGALISHRNVIVSNVQTVELLKVIDKDVIGIFTPLNHIAGTSFLFAGLHMGIPNVLVPVFDPVTAADLISNKGITMFCTFSPMTQKILDEASSKEINLGNTLRCMFGLDTPEVIQKVLDIGIDWYGVYAQTEVTGLLMAGRVTEPAKQLGLMGYSGLLSHITVLDDDGNQVEDGLVGEMCIRGDTVFCGYWNRPDDNEWLFRNRWLHTGDLVMRDKNGIFWFKGRKGYKELIKTGGENVYPAEVENTISKHQATEYVCIIGISDAKWLEAVKAVIKLKDGSSNTEEDIKQFCRDHLARYKVPKVIQFVDALPIKDGKVNREKVKELYGTDTRESNKEF
jgi:acyl-CoA synthetase (AMP-forming)/AMP-acid ligase II